MITNIGTCCGMCLNPNQDLYVEVRNKCPYHIHVYLNYRVDEERFSKSSRIFGPGQAQRLTFTFGALNVIFRAFNCNQTPEGILCSKFISQYRSSCYEVIGPGLGHIKCEEVAC